MALFGPPNVSKMEAMRDVKGLIKALQYQKASTVRCEAMRALGQIGDTRAVEPLIAALKDNHNGVREGAADTLGQLGDARAVVPLIAALNDYYCDVRMKVAKALGQLGDARAVEPLIVALKDKIGDMSTAAIHALVIIGMPAVEPLIDALRCSDGYVRRNVAEALGEIKDSRATGI